MNTRGKEPLPWRGLLLGATHRKDSSRAVRYIDFRGHRIVDGTVRGRIEWDESQPAHFALAVVDVKEVSLNDLVRMLMSMEDHRHEKPSSGSLS